LRNPFAVADRCSSRLVACWLWVCKQNTHPGAKFSQSSNVVKDSTINIRPACG
jgi:hypothetical protein